MPWCHEGECIHDHDRHLGHRAALRGRAAAHRRLLAGGELPVRRPDLPARQPAAPRAADRRAHQATAAGALGHHARAEPRLRTHQPGDPQLGPRRDLRDRSRPRRSRPRGQRLPGGHLHGASIRTSPGTRRACSRLFRQFSFPGGIPSHVAPETPGSIHEGGELGYSLAHAYGAAFDNPDLVVCCVIGDGEAETGPLAASWHSNKFLDPARDGAVLPILHLNGYKIANPTVLARIPERGAGRAAAGLRLRPHFVAGDDPAAMHQLMAAAMDRSWTTSPRSSGRRAPATGQRPRAPALADDRAADAEGLDRAEGGGRPPGRGHVARPPGAADASAHEPGAPGLLEEWMRSYRPEELFDEPARWSRRLRGAAAQGAPADERQPARQRRRAAARPAAAGLPRVRRRGAEAGRPRQPRRPASWAASCAT